MQDAWKGTICLQAPGRRYPVSDWDRIIGAGKLLAFSDWTAAQIVGAPGIVGTTSSSRYFRRRSVPASLASRPKAGGHLTAMLVSPGSVVAEFEWQASHVRVVARDGEDLAPFSRGLRQNRVSWRT